MTKKKRIIKTAILLLVMTAFTAAFSVTAFADGGSVSQAIEGTWSTASGQIKDVVNNVVFPIIDVILAVPTSGRSRGYNGHDDIFCTGIKKDRRPL